MHVSDQVDSSESSYAVELHLCMFDQASADANTYSFN
jgi:hypothetical protein